MSSPPPTSAIVPSQAAQDVNKQMASTQVTWEQAISLPHPLNFSTFTCCAVSKHFFIIGTSKGTLYVFQIGRKKNTQELDNMLLISSAELEKKNIVFGIEHVMISPGESLIAVATTHHGIFILDIVSSSNMQWETFLLKEIKLLSSHFMHDGRIECLCFSADGKKLFSGDIKGNVNELVLPAKKGAASLLSGLVKLTSFNTIIKEGADSPIVQLNAIPDYLLASSTKRTMIVNLKEQNFKVVGSTPRSGAFGAGYCTVKKQPAPEQHIYAARPGRRIWRCDNTGKVANTLKYTVGNQQVPFGVLYPLDSALGPLLVSYSNEVGGHVEVLDVGKVRIFDSREDLGKIIYVSVCYNSCYVLHQKGSDAQPVISRLIIAIPEPEKIPTEVAKQAVPSTNVVPTPTEKKEEVVAAPIVDTQQEVPKDIVPNEVAPEIVPTEKPAIEQQHAQDVPPEATAQPPISPPSSMESQQHDVQFDDTASDIAIHTDKKKAGAKKKRRKNERVIEIDDMPIVKLNEPEPEPIEVKPIKHKLFNRPIEEVLSSKEVVTKMLAAQEVVQQKEVQQPQAVEPEKIAEPEKPVMEPSTIMDTEKLIEVQQPEVNSAPVESTSDTSEASKVHATDNFASQHVDTVVATAIEKPVAPVHQQETEVVAVVAEPPRIEQPIVELKPTIPHETIQRLQTLHEQYTLAKITKQDSFTDYLPLLDEFMHACMVSIILLDQLSEEHKDMFVELCNFWIVEQLHLVNTQIETQFCTFVEQLQAYLDMNALYVMSNEPTLRVVMEKIASLAPANSAVCIAQYLLCCYARLTNYLHSKVLLQLA